MYCGHGVNDLLALAASDVGMALGNSHASAAAALCDTRHSVEGQHACLAALALALPSLCMRLHVLSSVTTSSESIAAPAARACSLQATASSDTRIQTHRHMCRHTRLSSCRCCERAARGQIDSGNQAVSHQGIRLWLLLKALQGCLLIPVLLCNHSAICLSTATSDSIAVAASDFAQLGLSL